MCPFIHSGADAASHAHQGHSNAITCLVATRDKSLLVSADAGPGSLIVLWDPTELAPIRTFADPSGNGVCLQARLPCLLPLPLLARPMSEALARYAGVAAMDLSHDGRYLACLSAVTSDDSAESREHRGQALSLFDLGSESEDPLVSVPVPGSSSHHCVRRGSLPPSLLAAGCLSSGGPPPGTSHNPPGGERPDSRRSAAPPAGFSPAGLDPPRRRAPMLSPRATS